MVLCAYDAFVGHSEALQPDTAPEVITARERDIFEADFARFDGNKDGVLTVEECEAMATWQLEQLGKTVDHAVVQQFVTGMGTNAVGKIDLPHFMTQILGPGWKKVEDLQNIAGQEPSTKAGCDQTEAEVY